MIEISKERLLPNKEQILPLAMLEWEESGHQDLPLDIDWDSYGALEVSGKCAFFTARDDDVLVGYIVVLVIASFTSRNENIAYVDSIYISENYRGKGLALDLFATAEAYASRAGITRIAASSSAKNPIGSLLEKLGFCEIETRYDKSI